MRELKSIKIIGVDAGYGNIKTANTVTPTGITAGDTQPIFNGSILEYGQRFNREIYDDARRYVSDHLPERKRIDIEQDSLDREERSIDPLIERQRPRNRRRDENVL